MPNKYLAILLLLILSLIWGSSFILVKLGLEVYTFYQLASYRILLTCLVFLPFVINKVKHLSKKELFFILLFGILNGGLPPFLFSKAQTVLNSSTAGILNSLAPLFTLLTGIMFFRIKFSLHKLAGVILGLGGALFLIIFRVESGFTFEFTADRFYAGIMIIIATVCYGFSSNILKSNLQNIPSVSIAGIAYMFLGLPMAVLLFNTDFIEVTTTNPQAWVALFYISLLAVLGTAIALVLYGELVKISNALFGASVTYLMPVVALLWGLVDGEFIGLFHIISITAIFAGIIISNKDYYFSSKREKLLMKK